jgi:linoleoyl-CoA desaturase
MTLACDLVSGPSASCELGLAKSNDSWKAPTAATYSSYKPCHLFADLSPPAAPATSRPPSGAEEVMGKGGDQDGLAEPPQVRKRGGIVEDRATFHAGTTGGKLTVTIDGNQYDMAGFDHPGGEPIMDLAGKDATTIFFSTHPTRVWRLIETTAFRSQYLVSESEAVRKEAKDKEGAYIYNDDFYVECKSVLEKHLRDHKARWGKHFDTAVVVVWTSVWLFAAACAYINMLVQHGSVVSGVVLGITWAMCVFNTMHPSMHGALCNIEPIKSIMDQTYTALSGSSCPRWIMRHNVVHHGHTNTSRDADKHASPFLRLHPAQPKRWYFAYQHIYFPLLACINTLSNQFRHLLWLWNEPPNQPNLRPAKVYQYYAALAVWFVLAYVIPIYVLGFRTAMGAGFIFQATGSAWATYNIVVNHIFEESHTSTESFGGSFAKMQAAGSCNFWAGSIVATFFSGGLNHQVEHHLFPSLPIHHLPCIASKIERVCKKHKVPYNNKSLFSLIASMHATLHLYGTCEPTARLPGLGDYQELMEG